MRYTMLLPHPVRWTTRTRCRRSTSASMAASWPSRNRASGPRNSASNASARSAVVTGAPYDPGVTVSVVAEWYPIGYHVDRDRSTGGA